MKVTDKKIIVNTFDEVTEKHFLDARLETLSRIRRNLKEKIVEIDDKISRLKKEYGAFGFELM
ncbi:MAG: hypothetical protein ACTSUE_05295 [Promethearchaeota archaeon]